MVRPKPDRPDRWLRPCPDPPPLIKDRIQQTEPFRVAGVDFAGVLYIREKDGESKAYVCLFTCTVTRAVHLEIVTDVANS